MADQPPVSHAAAAGQGTPPTASVMASLSNPSTLTTIVGALIAIAVGVTDAWVFHQLSYDQALIFGGLGALLGVNPVSLFRGT